MRISASCSKKLLLAAVLLAVAALTFGSVQSTGALWRDQASGQNAGTIKTGLLTLTAGSETTQSTAFEFDELKPSGTAPALIQPGDFVQRPLVIANGGTIPLKFRLGSVQLTSTSTGAGTVHVDVRQVPNAAACPTTGAVPVGSSTLLNADIGTKSSANGATPWLPLAVKVNPTSILTDTVLCVRSTLLTAPATQIKYRHVFTFQAEQAKNNP